MNKIQIYVSQLWKLILEIIEKIMFEFTIENSNTR